MTGPLANIPLISVGESGIGFLAQASTMYFVGQASTTALFSLTKTEKHYVSTHDYLEEYYRSPFSDAVILGGQQAWVNFGKFSVLVIVWNVIIPTLH